MPFKRSSPAASHIYPAASLGERARAFASALRCASGRETLAGVLGMRRGEPALTLDDGGFCFVNLPLTKMHLMGQRVSVVGARVRPHRLAPQEICRLSPRYRQQA